MSTRKRLRTEQLNLRVTPDELIMIRLAAAKADTTVTELVVSATLDRIQNGGLGFKGTLRRMREAGEV